MTGFWYIIHIYSGHEKKVKVNLEQRVQAVGLEEEILQVIIPTKEVVEVKNGKKRTFERPSYPGYILIQTANELRADAEIESSQKSWHLIRDTPGVMSFVGSSSHPPPLAEEEVQNALNISTDEEKRRPSPVVDYVVGDKVKVIDGPFNEFPAEIHGIDEEKQRLHLMISIFGRTTPIELEFFQVEKI
ncbi:MAG: transcription termination/antitermination protein NusG [Candidatus Poribacteria bacterium]|nr:transcription termination/antitermination protein NusG [Candidatus Poribacteria bacterium]